MRSTSSAPSSRNLWGWGVNRRGAVMLRQFSPSGAWAWPWVVVMQHTRKSIRVESIGRHPVSTDHRLRGDEAVDDGLLGRFDDRIEQRRDVRVDDRPDLHRERRAGHNVGGGRASVGGRKAKEEVAARVLTNPPVRAMPRPARWAKRSHCVGRRGALVATMAMIDPEPGGGFSGALGRGTSSAGTYAPTGTPLTVRRSRRP